MPTKLVEGRMLEPQEPLSFAVWAQTFGLKGRQTT